MPGILPDVAKAARIAFGVHRPAAGRNGSLLRARQRSWVRALATPTASSAPSSGLHSAQGFSRHRHRPWPRSSASSTAMGEKSGPRPSVNEGATFYFTLSSSEPRQPSPVAVDLRSTDVCLLRKPQYRAISGSHLTRPGIDAAPVKVQHVRIALALQVIPARARSASRDGNRARSSRPDCPGSFRGLAAEIATSGISSAPSIRTVFHSSISRTSISRNFSPRSCIALTSRGVTSMADAGLRRVRPRKRG